MLLECESCGAPLDVAEGASVVRCHYCGRNAAVAQFRQVAPVTPQGFVPPAQWTPRQGTPDEGRPLKFRSRPRSHGAFISLLMTAVIGAFVWRVTSAVQSATAPASIDPNAIVSQTLSAVGTAVDLAKKAKQAAAGNVTVPFACDGNDDVTITGKTLALPNGVPVVVGSNCTLRLVNCTVSGINAVIASGNGTVIVQGGSLTGTKGSAIILTNNAQLEASQGARFIGENTIVAAGNATARLRGASVTGAHVAIQASGNATVDTEGSDVHGRVTGGRHLVH